MHEALLAEGALPAPVRILGLEMQPYSIGHEVWLERQRNPLAEPPTANIQHPEKLQYPNISRSQLFEAVLICSESWDGGQRMNRDWLMLFKLWVWKWRTRKVSTELGVVQFRRYRAHGSLCFKTNPPSQGQVTTRRPGTPFLLRLQMFIMEQCRLIEAQAWDYPLGLASMKWCAYLESKECLEVENDLDAETKRFAESNDARLKVMIDSGMTDEQAWDQLGKEGLSWQA